MSMTTDKLGAFQFPMWRLLLTWPLLLLVTCRTSAGSLENPSPTQATTPVTLATVPVATPIAVATASTPTPAMGVTAPPATSIPSPTATVTTVPTPPPAPVALATGPAVDIPGSPYAVLEIQPLTPPACCPTLSPDGARLAFATCRTMTQKVYVQGADGSGLTEIADLTIHDGDGPCPDPAWSPDSRQLVFVHYNYDLYVVNADGTDLTRLEPKGLDPDWSPDGQQIALTAHSAQQELAIGVMDHDGNHFRLLTGHAAHNQRPAWSPDGRAIAFVSDRDGNREIYVMNSDGSDQTRLTHDQAQDWGPVWSPDGRHIVFTSDRSTHNAIYVMNRDGNDVSWLMDTAAPDRYPMDTTRVWFVPSTH